jgi:hypothetical protein
MTCETDQTLNIFDEPVIDENKSASGAESDVLTASSSSNVSIAKMADMTTPEMSDYWKKLTITKADHLASHSAG